MFENFSALNRNICTVCTLVQCTGGCQCPHTGNITYLYLIYCLGLRIEETLSIFLAAYLPSYLHICLYSPIFLYLPISLSIYPSAYLSFYSIYCPSYLLVYLYLEIYIFTDIYLSTYPPTNLSLYLHFLISPSLHHPAGGWTNFNYTSFRVLTGHFSAR
jgi:hypothetical protein